ncbi:hypothetical protein JCM10449v2_003199 [Rhodotorula kratochvilovae]
MGDIPVLGSYAQSSSTLPWPPAGPSSAAPPPSSLPAPAVSAPPKRAKEKSCAACRLRRVKCERPDGQDGCSSCFQRGLRCVPYEQKEKTQFRNGKRVKAAKELYGDIDALDSASTTSAGTSAASPAATDVLDRRSVVSYSSGDVRLGTIELKEAVMSNLLESFFTFKSVAVFDGDINFRHTFDLAGRRIDQLNSSNQVLCAVLLALGARCTDHPALLGSTAPPLSFLRAATQADTDLRAYGALRAPACATLTQQALALADEKGAFRTPTPENVAALVLLEGLVGVPPAGMDAAGFAVHYNAHVRELLHRAQGDERLRRRMQGTILSWTALLRDAFSSAVTGHSPLFSDDEFWLLRGEEDLPPPLSFELASPSSGSPDRDFWALLNAFVHHLAALARGTAAALTSVRATKRAVLDERFARRFLEEVREARDAMPELLKRTAALQTPQKVRSDAATLVRGLRLSTANLSFLLLRIVSERLFVRPTGIISDFDAYGRSGVPDAAYWDRLGRLERECRQEAGEAAREMVAVLRAALDEGIPLGTHEWLDVRGAMLLFGKLPMWSAFVVERVTAEEGGGRGYSLREKVDDLRTIARALRSIGWASADLARPLDWITSELAKAEAQQALLCPFPALTFSFPPPPYPFSSGIDALLAQPAPHLVSATDLPFSAATSTSTLSSATTNSHPVDYSQVELHTLLESLAGASTPAGGPSSLDPFPADFTATAGLSASFPAFDASDAGRPAGQVARGRTSDEGEGIRGPLGWQDEPEGSASEGFF